MAVGDFNGDGKLDLGVSSLYVFVDGEGFIYNFVRANVLLGDGAGSFAEPQTADLGGYGAPPSVAVADFNGDGRDDFASGTQSGPIVVYQANPDGSLGDGHQLGYGSAGAMVAGDVSGDGKPDLVIAGYAQSVGVLLGDGFGGFEAVRNYPTGGDAVSLILGDFNGLGGDGHLDIATANDSGSGLSVLLNRGDGTFTGSQNSAPGSNASGVAAGDFNGDGWLDAVTAIPSANGVSVFLNDRNWPPPSTPTITIDSDVTVAEGNTGTVGATFTVRLTKAYGQPVTVRFSTADGNAVSGSDYEAVSQTLTFAPGQTTKAVTVSVKGDRLPETNESFYVHLSDATNAFLADATRVGTIVDDEPDISIEDGAVTEGNSGTRPLTFTVTLSAPYDQAVTLGYATQDVTAVAGSDYNATSGTLTFAPGQTTKTISVLVKGDRLGEHDEALWLNLNSSTNAGLGTVQVAGIILDDEPVFSIGAEIGSVVEGNSGTRAITFTVTLSAATDAPVTVRFATADLTREEQIYYGPGRRPASITSPPTAR